MLLLMEDKNMGKKEYDEVETFYIKLDIPFDSDSFSEHEYYDFFDSKENDRYYGWRPLEV